MFRGMIEDIEKTFSEYFNLFGNVAYIPLSKVQEISENLENAISRIGTKNFYSVPEFAIIDMKRHIAGIEDTAAETPDCETCYINVQDFSEHLEIAKKLVSN